MDLHFGRYVVPQIFFPGMLFPVLVFLCLYAYPFVDQMFSFDPTEQSVLALPQQRPFNTAFGCSVLMAMLVLLFAGGDDVIAVATDTSVITIRAILRVLFFVAPAFTAFIVYRLCRRKILRRDSETH